MARPERPLDPAASPVAAFAHDLRRLRAQAGYPSYRRLAVAASYSATALSKAASGEQFPSLEITLGYVKACGGDPAALEEWRVRWIRLRASLDRSGGAPGMEPGQVTAPEVSMAGQALPFYSVETAAPSPRPGANSAAARKRARRPVLIGALAAVTGPLAVLALLALRSPHQPAAAHHSIRQVRATPHQAAGAMNPDANSKGVIEPVRRHGPAVITPGHVIDLDSLAPDWANRAGYPYPPYDLEFTLAHHTLAGEDPAVLGVLPGGSTGTRYECGALEAYGTEIAPDRIKPGVMFCVMTGQNRYVLLRITGVLYSSTRLPVQVSLDVKVWQAKDAQNGN